jgi:hypothetical protein
MAISCQSGRLAHSGHPRCFGSTQGMRGELARVETDTADPLGYEPIAYCRVLKDR